MPHLSRRRLDLTDRFWMVSYTEPYSLPQVVSGGTTDFSDERWHSTITEAAGPISQVFDPRTVKVRSGADEDGDFVSLVLRPRWLDNVGLQHLERVVSDAPSWSNAKEVYQADLAERKAHTANLAKLAYEREGSEPSLLRDRK